MTTAEDTITAADVADHIAALVGELAAMAQAAGFAQTAANLKRAELSALADLRRLQPGKSVSGDAA